LGKKEKKNVKPKKRRKTKKIWGKTKNKKNNKMKKKYGESYSIFFMYFRLLLNAPTMFFLLLKILFLYIFQKIEY
jgi:hypothetical protein